MVKWYDDSKNNSMLFETTWNLLFSLWHRKLKNQSIRKMCSYRETIFHFLKGKKYICTWRHTLRCPQISMLGKSHIIHATFFMMALWCQQKAMKRTYLTIWADPKIMCWTCVVHTFRDNNMAWLLISFKVDKVVAFGYKNGDSWNIMVDLVASKKMDDIAFTQKKPTFGTFQNHLIKSIKNQRM